MRRLLNTLPIVAVLAYVLGSIESTGAEGPNETYRQIIAKRATPNLKDLAERASPDQAGETATESFWDLLKLRDQPVADAVPELIRILASHDGSNRIHGFAAAQALFAANSDEARRALDARLLSPDYPVDLAAMYTSHWQMAEPARSRFIEAYLLRNLSKDLDVTVEAHWSDDTKPVAGDNVTTKEDTTKEDTAKGDTVARTLVVKVTLANASKRTLAINVEQTYQGKSLFFRGPSGAYLRPMQTAVYGPSAGRWLRLDPGGTTSYDVALELKTDPESLAKSRRLYSDEAEAKALLETSDVACGVTEFGEYKLSAMVARAPLLEEHQKLLRDKQGIEPHEVWSGRAVSPPVKIELGTASPPQK